MPSAGAGGALDPARNGITALRLGLALLVVVSHAYVAGGFGHDPLHGLTGGALQLGTVAVVSFFGLSGFLLAGARRRRSRGAFAAHRLLRVWPGLAFAVGLTVLVAVPLAGRLTGSPAEPGLVAAWARAALLLSPFPVDVPGLWGGGVRPAVVNASLWTLPVEVLCYAGLWLVPVRLLAPATALAAGLALGLLAGFPDLALVFQLPAAFAAGVLLEGLPDRLRPGGRAAALALAATVAAVPAGLLAVAVPVTLPPVALWAGLRLPVRWGLDLSYGTYLAAWPVQQLLALAGAARGGVLPYLAVTVPVVLAVAAASALLVERPALRLRRFVPG